MSSPLPDRRAAIAGRARGWLAAARVYREPATLRMFTLGFSAGLPLLLVLGTLSFRLREAGINRATIGELSWVGLAYAFKWVWAPLVDRLPLPLLDRLLGRRRSWLLLAQFCVMAGLAGLAACDPAAGLRPVVAFALLTAFASATQDIALDAYRIESARTEQQGALAAAYQAGYRIAMIWAGAGVLWLAAGAEAAGGASAYQNAAWAHAYRIMALSMLVGVATVLGSPEPAPRPPATARSLRAWLRDALAEPFADFLRRFGWRAGLVLALIAVYRISDVVMGIMANPFYVDMGYTKEEVAAVSKIFGVLMTLLGSFVGGALALRLGVMRVLMVGAVAGVVNNLLFAWLSTRGHDLGALVAIISVDNFASGMASSAFIAYLSGLTSQRYSATQYAVFSSLMLLLPKFLAGFSGHVVDHWGYASFFLGTDVIGLPVIALVALVARLPGRR